MKLNFLFFAFLLFFIEAESQTIVRMEKRFADWTVPCKVNEYPTVLVFNSLQKDGLISPSLVSDLLKNSFLYPNDFVEVTDHDSLRPGTKLNLSILEIDNHFVYNSLVVVSDTIKTSLILGKSVIDKFGKVTFDYSSGNLTICDVPLYKNDYGVKVGCVSGNCLNGRGAYLYPGGAVYVGDFKEGDPMGLGTYLYEDGSKFMGHFRNGEYEGSGVLIQPDGSVYVGNFQSGEFDGFGRMNFASGKKYIGEFKEGIFNGYGVYLFSNGQKYSGNFADGEYNGKGTMVFANGAVYTGDFKSNKREGAGTYTLPSGLKYTGEFRNGVYNGNGVLTMPDGTVKSGVFLNGEYTGK